VKRAALLVLLASTALAGDRDGWVSVNVGNVTVKARNRPGTAVREMLADADLDAPVERVQQALLSCERFKSFMPYVAESRFIDGTSAKDERFKVYTRLEFPAVSSRDYIVESHTVKRAGRDGDDFQSEWKSLPDFLPKRANAVRVRINEGSWHVTPRPGGKSHVTYRSLVDPGGLIPAPLADYANRIVLPDMFKAIEKEAKRLEATDAGAPARP
jgi:hypothetical protein